MYSAAVNLYGEFLKDTTKYEVSDDIDTIIQDKTLDSTEKNILVNSRIGQGQFRQSLINYWGRCAITGFKDSRFLVASHIKPWRAANNYERLDRYNGILLLPNLDKTFDLGYISFNKTGEILISNELDEYKKLGILPGMKVNLERRHQPYLKYHREVVFEKRKNQ